MGSSFGGCAIRLQESGERFDGLAGILTRSFNRYLLATSAANNSKSIQFLPSTDCSLRVTVIAASKRDASSANAAAGRMCNPCGLATVTIRRTDPLIHLKPLPQMNGHQSCLRAATLLRIALQQRPNIVARSRLAEFLDKFIVPHAPHYVFQSAQMVAGAVLRGNQQHQYMHRLPVDAFKSYSRSGQGNRADELVHAAMLGMGNGDRTADAGGPELFAPHDGPDDFIDVEAGKVTGQR